MKSKSFLLLKNLLRSTSGVNILRYEKDSKKKSKIIGGYVGMAFLFLFIMAFVVLTVIGYGQMGLTKYIPSLCAITICIIEFFFTIMKTNGYLFAFKEYDMLMALPFKPSQIAGTKFLYMYVKNLPWVLSISLAALVGYGIYAKPAFGIYLLWIIISFLLPLIPMVIAAAVGAIIAGIGSGFRYKQLVQTILTFAFILVCFASRFVIEAVVKNNKVDDIILAVSSATDKIMTYYLPVKWFNDAICSGNIMSALLFIFVSILVFASFAVLVGKSYRKINSRLSAGVARKKYKMGKQKKKSIVNTIAFKEFKRFTSSTLYITNMGMGELLGIIVAIGVLFVDMNKVILAMTNGVALDKRNFIATIPFVIYFAVGMVPTTTASLSLEGKSIWIVKSLPIEMKDVVAGKILFNMYLTVPITLLATLTVGIKCGADFGEIATGMILGLVLCTFSSLFGMLCNILHLQYDWENEIDVIKKGASVGIYILVNMIMTCLFFVAALAMGFIVPVEGINVTICIFFAFMCFICYKCIVTKVKKL